jgi:hypothetical protein
MSYYRFVLDQHAELDFYSASSLKQQSAGRHVSPLGHIILIPSRPVFALSPDRGWNPQSTALEASTLTITPSMRFLSQLYFPYISYKTTYFQNILLTIHENRVRNDLTRMLKNIWFYMKYIGKYFNTKY